MTEQARKNTGSGRAPCGLNETPGRGDRPKARENTPADRGGDRSGKSESTGRRRSSSRGRRQGKWKHVFSALDLGTNNCRLLVARPTQRGFKVINGFSRIVRLGEGLTAEGRLSDDAMSRTVEALRICADKMDRSQVTMCRNIATEACRRASNCDEFLGLAKSEAGLDFEIVSPAEEARLAVAGCQSLLDQHARYAIVFDIGGGSTELIWLRVRPGKRPRMLAWTSMPCGVVTLSERYGGTSVSRHTYEAMIDDVTEYLADFESRNGISEFVGSGHTQLLGTSGTVTTLAGVHLGLERYDRSRVDGLWLDQAHVTSVSDQLAAMTWEERVAEPCVGRERADLVIAGCAVLEAITRMWPAPRLRVADRGLREGILMALIRDAERDARRAANGTP